MKPLRKAKAKLECTITCQDWAAFMQTVEYQSAALILTDPPYNISDARQGEKKRRFTNTIDYGPWDYDDIDLKAFAEHSWEVLKPGGAVVLFYDLWKITEPASHLWDTGFRQFRLIEWIKRHPKPYGGREHYLSNCREVAIFAKKKGKSTFNAYCHDGRYRAPKPGPERIHPTQKPFNLIQAIILNHTNPGDLVIDPFSGSGTTAVAAALAGRRFLGSDISEDYVTAANKRVITAFYEADE